MQLRVGDDADRVRPRCERDQPGPVAGADEMVGREPARRRDAARLPRRVGRPVVDGDALADAEPHGVGVVAVRLGELALLLDQSGAAARVDEPARAHLPLAAVAAEHDPVLAAVFAEREVAHRRAVGEADAAAQRLLGEEVLEQAAVDLVARDGERPAGADLGDAVDVVASFRREEAEAELLQLRGLEVLAQAEHFGEIVGADLDRRLADLVRRDRHRMDAPLENEDVEVGEGLLQVQGERQPGETAAGDDDVVARDGDFGHESSDSVVGVPAAVETARALSDRTSDRPSASVSVPSRSGVAGDRFEKGQGAGHRIAAEASRCRGPHRRRGARAGLERPLDRRHRARARPRCQNESAGEKPLALRHRRERAGGLDVEGDEQHRPRVGLHLQRRFEQAGAEAGVERRQRAARFAAVGADRPVARGGVVDRVVELGRRDQRRRGRQRRAHVVVDREVAVRRREDRRQRRRVEPRLAHRRRGDLERERDGVRRAAPFGGGEDLGRGALGRRRQGLALAAQRGARDRPARQRRRPEGDALDREGAALRRRRAHRARSAAGPPNTRTQLLPPKPNELLAATRTGACPGAMRTCGPQAASRTRVLAMPGRRPLLDREQGGGGLDDAGRAERVAGDSLGRARVRRRREPARDERGLDLVVLRARRAVQVDVVDRTGIDAGAGERVVERALGAEALGMRRRHVMRVARLAVAEQAKRGLAVVALEQGEAGRLADADAAALGVERPARLGRDELQGVEAEQDAAAKRVDAADDRRVDQAQAKHPLGAGEHLRARRARRRDRHARTFEIERLAHEGGERMRRVDQRVAVVGGEGAARVEVAVGVLGRADARRRRAQHDRDARRAVALARGMDGVDEAVALQAQPGEPVVAALPGGEGLRQRRRFEAVDAADPGRQRRRAEVVRRQRAAVLAQGCQEGALAHAGSARDGVGDDADRGDRGGHGSANGKQGLRLSRRDPKRVALRRGGGDRPPARRRRDRGRPSPARSRRGPGARPARAGTRRRRAARRPGR